MIYKIFKNNRGLPREAKRSGGFTILESIVAIGILSTAIAGVFTAIQSNLSQSITAKDEVKAFYLAQEAVEVVRHLRDNNQLKKINDPTFTGNWLTDLANSGDPCEFDKVCRANAHSLSLARCGDDWEDCSKLRQSNDPNDFQYGYGYDLDWPETNFRRELMIERINDNEVWVTVSVTWTKGIMTREFKAKTTLLNWI